MTPRWVVEDQREPGVVLHLLRGVTPGLSDDHLHAPRLGFESEHREIGDDAEHAAGEQAAFAPRLSPPRRKPGLVMKSTCSTKRRFSCFIATIICVRLAMSLPPPVPGSRVFGLRRIADERAVQIAVLVDLRAAHEADVDIAALQQQQHFGAAEHHVGALGAALIVGRGRQLARLDEGADHAAFEQDRQAGAAQPLRKRGGQQRNADAGEHHLPVAELPRAQDGEQLRRGVVVRLQSS